MTQIFKRLSALFLITCLVLASALPIFMTEADANATDTLTFKIGYYGWDASQYVEKKTFSVSEIKAASSSDLLAYTYYDSSGHRIAIDSAHGATLDTLLDKAGIDKGSINTLAFYTTDSGNGAFATFTMQELVLTDRYYFPNLAAAINQEGKYVDSNAKNNLWNNATKVPVVLAYEDKWTWYPAETEGAEPSASGMKTDNRFRLCFGQSNPLDYRTFQSAKMVETIYVMFSGTPEITADESNLKGKVGSTHQIKVTAAVADDALEEGVMQGLQFSSSDESVATVDSEGNIKYVGEGDATITITSGGSTTTVTVHVGKDDKPEKEEDKKEDGKGQGSGKGNSANGNGKADGTSKTPGTSTKVQVKKDDKSYMYVLSENASQDLKNALAKQAPAEMASMNTYQEKMAEDAEQLEIKKEENGLGKAMGAVFGIITVEGSLFGFIRFRRML